MSNKIDTIVGKIATALAVLLRSDGTGTLRAVVRRSANPLNEPKLPLVAIQPMSLRRSGGAGSGQVWTLAINLAIVTRTRDTSCDAVMAELIGEVQAAIDALMLSPTAGVVLDMPAWQLLYDVAGGAAATTPVMAIGEVRAQFNAAIKG